LAGLYISLAPRRQRKNDAADFASKRDTQSEGDGVKSAGERDLTGLRDALGEQAAKE
jgi:hypothetical protein